MLIKKIYAYSDEAIFYRGDSELVGTGILFTEVPIEKMVIENAINKLKLDTDFDLKKDKKTIDRFYFHGSEDSKNAHSHLCREIVKQVNGDFVYSYINKTLDNKRSIEQINRLTLQLSSIQLFDEPYEVEMIVEERSTFGKNNIEDFLNTFNRNIEAMAYSHPSFISIFPKLSIEVRNKKEYGLQVVDFMLWAMNRHMKVPSNSTWKNYLNLKMRSESKVEDDSQFGGHYYLNSPCIDLDLKRMINYPYTVPLDIPKKGTHIVDYYNFIEEIIISYQEIQLPKHCYHLTTKLNKAIRLIKSNVPYKEGDIKLIASTFIQIFDTVPVYKDININDKEIWLDILYAKKLSGLLLREGKMYFGMTRDSIIRWRYDKVRNSSMS